MREVNKPLFQRDTTLRQFETQFGSLPKGRTLHLIAEGCGKEPSLLAKTRLGGIGLRCLRNSGCLGCSLCATNELW